ncbi:hypothetical protein EK0264_03600 [Epidermidibacterium keratini]|uniref:Uncharacterized protein n=1 Tax=Epidermidibacterium keratini TaxID=1891644 RepID=A0A7L4YJI5_9ACTN|nr:hypothetical protein [Epidermidibacterium keratini]QHB99454.1 hypothetical protein EK0264_03600 [Epidermidibacterium keratini]
MSDAIARMRESATRVQNLTYGGTIKRSGEVIESYEQLARAAAHAEAEYRRVKAIAALQAMTEGKASAAKAEHVANADDGVADACQRYKVTAAVLDARNKALMAEKTAHAGWVEEIKRDTVADRIEAKYAP